MTDKDRTMSQLRQGLLVLEQDCRGLDCDTLFFGPRKYIQDLCVIISHQKEYIQSLEGRLQTLGVDLQLLQRGQDTTVQTHTVHGKVIGSVLGHETRVIQSLHKLLHRQHVALKIQDTEAIEPVNITLLFHRKKARLPQDEIQALLSKVSAQGTPGHVIVIFMHNIASGHEKTLFNAVVPNNTDPGCWPPFARQCLLITDMTFDETKFNWNETNKNALHLILAAISTTATPQTSSHDQDSLPANQQDRQTSEQLSASPWPSTNLCGQQ